MNIRCGCVIALIAYLLIHSPSALADDALKQRLQTVSAYLLNEQNRENPNQGKHETGFEEKRFSELLSEPAIFSGTLVYEPATRSMSKIVSEPDEISMIMTEKAVIIESSEGKRRLSLRARPALRAILVGFRALVEGDIEALRSHFELDYKDNDSVWTLVLTPRSQRLARRLTSLVVSGQDTQVDSMVTTMQNGDRQEMTLLPVSAINE